MKNQESNMKNTLIYTFSLLAAIVVLFACEKQTTPEPIRIQRPDLQSPFPRDDAYYARLRAYKLTDHKLAFGWYGSWTAIGASEQSRLRSAPDSMDIISMWSQWHSLSREQIEDKAFVQQIKGTKVVFCISAKDMPDEFKVDGEITEEGIVAYAKAWGKDSMDKYQYDGMDIDFETAIDHQGPMNTNPANFKKFAEELSKYIGPKSGTGRLFLIDGNVDSNWLPDNIAELCDYAVSQAYNCSGPGNLRSRTASAGGMGWRPEQMIFTENFESLWQSGGANYSYNGETIPSLLGMAHFAAEETAAGFGSYHMEYEYGNAEMPYKYIREAIQIANPAPQGDYTKNLLSLNEAGEEKYSITMYPSGLGETLQTTMTAEVASVTDADADISLVVDNGLVTTYNDYNYTEYRTLDPALVAFSGPLHFAAGTRVTAEPVTITIADFSKVEDGEYLVPLRADFPKGSGFSANTSKEVRYLMISKSTGINNVTLAGEQIVGITVLELPDGTLEGDVSHSVSAEFSNTAPAATEMALIIDPSLVAAYNEKNGTDYTAIAASDVAVSGKLLVEKGANASSSVKVSMADLAKLTALKSMIAMRVDLSGQTDYQPVNENSIVKYILVTRSKNNVESGAAYVDGRVIEDRTGWIYSIEGQDTGAIGGFDNGQMFDGNQRQMGWYSSIGGKRWAQIDMTKPQTIVGWRMGMVLGSVSYQTYKLYDIQTSLDGSDWTDQSVRGEAVAIGSPDGDDWQYVKFLTPVECRYVRMTYENTPGSAGNGFIGSCEWNAIAPNN